MPAISAKVPGKTILFGEHAVVYGYPAIAVPINSIHLKTTIIPLPGKSHEEIKFVDTNSGKELLLNDLNQGHTFKAALRTIQEGLSVNHFPSMEIRISSSIPSSAGLGSSAALAVALSRSVSSFLGFKLSEEKINQFAYEIEKHQHGTPSGIDNTVITYNQPVYYIKGRPPQFIQISNSFTLLIADSGLRTPTRDTVQYVRQSYERNRTEVEGILNQIGDISQKALTAMQGKDICTIGALMSSNHALLEKLGVSNEKLNNLVTAAQNSGAYGAKLCGGGRGGNIIAVVPPEAAESLKDELLNAGAVNCFVSTVYSNREGVKK